MEFLYSKKRKCAPRGEEDDTLLPLGRESVRRAHTLFGKIGQKVEKVKKIMDIMLELYEKVS